MSTEITVKKYYYVVALYNEISCGETFITLLSVYLYTINHSALIIITYAEIQDDWRTFAGFLSRGIKAFSIMNESVFVNREALRCVIDAFLDSNTIIMFIISTNT